MADIIDINVFQSVNSVSFEVEPITNIVNINKITGGGGGGSGSQDLQSVTDIGATTSKNITANAFIKLGGIGNNLLLDNGTTIPTTSIVSTTNLSPSQTATNFTINSDTGTDATIPLGNGTLAGATLNNYTTAEKALVASIPNLNTDAVDRETVKLSENINKGQAVYVSSATGTNIIVSKASNTSEGTSSKTWGLLETTGVTNDIVKVITGGLFAGLNTGTATQGDAVWLGTNGDLIFGLTNKPIAPAHLVYIGIVTRVSTTVGEIFVSIQNGFELNEIHNILINGTLANEDFLQYESSTSLWKNKQLTNTLIKSKLGITNLSGDNTGDDATNSQYSGLATSKQDTLVSTVNIKSINGQSIVGSGNLTISATFDDLDYVLSTSFRTLYNY